MSPTETERWLKDERLVSPCFAGWDGKFRRTDIMRMNECGKTIFRAWWNHSRDRDPTCHREEDYDADSICLLLERFDSLEPDPETVAQLAELEE